uniref:Uncharacterized protein n=1 Tax=Panagrolaimus sp. PS1159 TaxID=55785 RepID=A0AC35GU98_9BILA
MGNSINHKTLKDILLESIADSIQKSYISPTISIISSYYSSLKDEQLPPSSSDAYFDHHDKDLKQALADYNQTNQSKKRSEFLTKDFLETIHQCLQVKPLNIDLLKTIIKYGYPLPISVSQKIAKTIHEYLLKSKIYSAGISLEVFDEAISDKKLICQKYGEGKARLNLRPLSGHLFICQADYHSYIGMLDASEVDDTEKAYFYERLLGFLKHLKKHFPKQGDSLREILLKNM